MSITPGPKRPNHAAKMPARTLIPARLAARAPMYAERLNNGPGIACTTPRPAKNCSSVIQEFARGTCT